MFTLAWHLQLTKPLTWDTPSTKPLIYYTRHQPTITTNPQLPQTHTHNMHTHTSCQTQSACSKCVSAPVLLSGPLAEVFIAFPRMRSLCVEVPAYVPSSVSPECGVTTWNLYFYALIRWCATQRTAFGLFHDIKYIMFSFTPMWQKIVEWGSSLVYDWNFPV